MTHKRVVTIPMPCCGAAHTLAVSVDVLERHIGTEVTLDVPDPQDAEHMVASCPVCKQDWDYTMQPAP